ncbi:MAG TPA: glycosyltransferase family 4 protein [Terriglobales bacterium]|nr:glycosyltransferase family 4 protein [Terriglobales bacterium]
MAAAAGPEHRVEVSVVASNQPLRVLYSFPHKLGAGRICYTAWQQVHGLAAAGAEVLVFPGVLHRPLPANVAVRPTLARGRWRIPYRLLGTLHACALHDRIVARRLQALAGQIDVVHTWPLAALHTLRAAVRLGIPTVLERPNAHTRFAYLVVQQECERLAVELPPDHEHAWKSAVLAREEEEYRQAYRLLCPSDFVVQTFLQQGFPRERLLRHDYGFDETRFYPDDRPRAQVARGLTVLFAGVCAVRKGLHFALEAWLRSPAHRDGAFLIAGEFLPAYARRLAYQLSQPSVRVLGNRNDLPDLMRQSDILVLPSIEEGYGLVCAEAMGSGCVPLVSDACTEICVHMGNALVHRVGDVDALTRHLTMVHQDRGLLQRLRDACLRDAPRHTWTAAGAKLLLAYRQAIAEKAGDAVPSELQLCA